MPKIEKTSKSVASKASKLLGDPRCRYVQSFCAGVIGATLALTAGAQGGIIIVDHTLDVSGAEDAEGMSARTTWEIDGTTLTILLENTSTSSRPGRGISDELITSLGFDLGDVWIVSGDSAVVGPDSHGLGRWSAFGPGDSVADEWLWSNLDGESADDWMDGAGAFGIHQIISTSMGVGGATRTDFNGDRAHVNGPFGGIASQNPEHPFNGNQRAVSTGILFQLTLNDTIDMAGLLDIAEGSVAGFGSGSQQFIVVPAPGPLGLIAIAILFAMPRRRSA